MATNLEDNYDFKALLTYRPSDQGGRQTPAKSGYRPHIKFDFDKMLTSGEQTFIEREWVFPGETIEANIRIIAVEHFAGRLTEGLKFEFGEGPTIIGIGEILQILNERLRKPAGNIT